MLFRKLGIGGTALTSAPYPADRVLPRIGGTFGALPEQDEDLSDVLNWLRSGLSADLREDRLALGAICAGNAHLYQLVAFQSAVNFCEHCRRQPGSPDQHDRIERVRPCLQFAPPSG